MAEVPSAPLCHAAHLHRDVFVQAAEIVKRRGAEVGRGRGPWDMIGFDLESVGKVGGTDRIRMPLIPWLLRCSPSNP